MTDQRTLKRIINEQRAEIQQLKREIESLIVYIRLDNIDLQAYKEQVEAAKTILKMTTDHEYGTVAYADYRSAQIDRLKEVLETAQNSG